MTYNHVISPLVATQNSADTQRGIGHAREFSTLGQIGSILPPLVGECSSAGHPDIEHGDGASVVRPAHRLTGDDRRSNRGLHYAFRSVEFHKSPRANRSAHHRYA